MSTHNIVAACTPWHWQVFKDRVQHFPGSWHLVKEPGELERALALGPVPYYIFFPHWRWKVPETTIARYRCVGFHETELPRGRGGSPIQNLIEHGYRETKITAFRMTHEVDAGPIYYQVPVSLEGLAEEVYLRVADKVADIMDNLILFTPWPQEQHGAVTCWPRRTPEQSRVANKMTLPALFDHLRMLDAEGYPRAFLEVDGWRYEFSRPALRVGCIEANVTITRIDDVQE